MSDSFYVVKQIMEQITFFSANRIRNLLNTANTHLLYRFGFRIRTLVWQILADWQPILTNITNSHKVGGWLTDTYVFVIVYDQRISKGPAILEKEIEIA